MPSTPSTFALLDRIQAASLATLYNPLVKDLFQIKTIGGDTVISVTSTGVVVLNPSAPSPGTLFGVYSAQTNNLTLSVAQYFAGAFPTNPGLLDIFQLWAPNGSGVVYHIDYLGVAFTP